MKKEEIFHELEKHDSSVLSFPERGPWGDYKYRGNCSGWIHAFLIWKYGVKKMAELFAGSGTGYDVCKDIGCNYIGADLNPNPKRPGILSVDALTDEVPDEFYEADLTFMHPPYGAEIGIPYAGSMYSDPTGDLSQKDLGQMPWDSFIKTLNYVVMKYFAAMESGSRMSILMGTVSNRRNYTNKNFVPLVHEYILVIKKLAPYILDFQIPMKRKLDARDSKSATWKDVVYAAVTALHGKASLSQIYGEIEGHEKAKKNPYWKEKVRQTLQIYPMFSNIDRGVWQIAA